MRNLTCQECQDALPWLIAGQLDHETQHAARHHLLTCPHCQAEAAQWREIAAYARAGVVEPPPPVWEHLPAQLATALPAPQTQKGTITMEFDDTPAVAIKVPVQVRQRHTIARRAYPLAAAFLLVILVVTFALVRRIPPSHTPLAPGANGFSTSACPTPVPLHLPQQSMLLHLQMTSPAEGWLTGSYHDPASYHDSQPDPLLMHFQQCHWTQVPLAALHGFILTSLDMLSADQGWAIASLMPPGSSSAQWRSVVLQYHDGQWDTISIPAETHGGSGYTYSQIVMTAPDAGWIVANAEASYVLRMQHGVWSVAPAAFAATVAHLQGVALQDTTVWGYGTTADERAPFIARLVRDTWQAEKLPASLVQGRILHMSIVAANDIWAVGDADGYAPFLLHYDGTTWRQVPLPAGILNPNPQTMVMVSAHEGWVIVQSVTAHDETTLTLHEQDGVWKVSAPLPAPTGPGAIAVTDLTPAFAGEAWGLGSVALNTDGTAASTISDETATVILHLHNGKWEFYNPYPHHSS